MENANFFWTVLRAQKELDGIRTAKMTATLSTFQKRKNNFKIFISDVAISRKTSFWETKTKQKFVISDPKYRNFGSKLHQSPSALCSG